MNFVGLLIASLSLILAMGLSVGVAPFLSFPSALIVTAVGFGTLLFAHGPKSLDLLVRALAWRVTKAEAHKAATVAHSATKSFNSAGLLGFIIGLVAMLANLDDPAAIGPAMAVALLTVFYGVLMSTLLWAPAERRMRALAMEHPQA